MEREDKGMKRIWNDKIADRLYQNKGFIILTLVGVVLLTLLFTVAPFRVFMARSILSGKISFFVLFYTAGIITTVFLSWLYGGKKTLVFVTILWNFEILFLISYRDNWEHAVELVNILAFFILYWIESPSDRRERLLREELAMANMVALNNKMNRTVERAVAASKNTLQELELTWESHSRSFIHRLKNRFSQFRESDLSLKDQDDLLVMVYDEVVKPFEGMILEEVGKLAETSAQQVVPLSVPVLFQELYRLIPRTVTESRAYRFLYRELPADLDNPALICETSLRILYNEILFNLITNSARAIALQKDRCREEGRSFAGRIEVSFAKAGQGKQDLLMIAVRDNGGGFPRDVLSEVYTKPIHSSDRSRPGRLGEGTVWTAFYTQLLHGFIQAGNYECEDGTQGATTALYFPLTLREGE